VLENLIAKSKANGSGGQFSELFENAANSLLRNTEYRALVATRILQGLSSMKHPWIAWSESPFWRKREIFPFTCVLKEAVELIESIEEL